MSWADSLLNELRVLFSDVLVKKEKLWEAQLGNKAKFIKQDVTSEEEWKMAVSEAENTFGPVNILVNNAGYRHKRPNKRTCL